MREVCWLGQKCDFHEKSVQQRRNYKVVGVLRTQCGELPTHLDEIKRLVVRLLFQMKRPAIKRSAAPNMFGATTSPWVDPDGAMSGAEKVALRSDAAIEL